MVHVDTYTQSHVHNEHVRQSGVEIKLVLSLLVGQSNLRSTLFCRSVVSAGFDLCTCLCDDNMIFVSASKIR